jgi:hypothetical protein
MARAPLGRLSLERLVRTGLRRGLLGGERAWLVAGLGALGLQLVMRAVRKHPKVVYSERLAPGSSLVIEHRPPPGRRGGHNGRREGPASEPQA